MALHLTSIDRATPPRLQPWEMHRLARLIEDKYIVDKWGNLHLTLNQHDLDGIVDALRIAAELA